MSTEHRIDRGNHVEVLVGEPTWQEPTEWSHRTVEWKPGTAEHNAAAIEQGITDALAELRQVITYPALPAVPDGTMTTAVLSNVVRALRNEAQINRLGVQRAAATLAQTIRLVRGDFDDID